MENKFISLCMIVKNEQDNLSNCLSSLKNYVDEIVIVDTGSIDKTKEIAANYTQNIYDFEWGNDFAAARNFSISKARYEWILVIDADETVTAFDRNDLNKFMNDNDQTVGRIKRINPFEDASGTKRYIERVNRFFNQKNFQYEGIIHEQLVKKDGQVYNTLPLSITADHTGYTNDVVKRTGKLDRNISLLKIALNDNMSDSYILYQLGKSYYMKKEYKLSSEYFEKAMNNKPGYKLEYVEDLIESFGYSLINSENYSKALEILAYKKNYKNSIDYNFLCGIIYMNNAKFSEAVLSFTNCIGDNEGKIEGINSYLPNYNIGVIFHCLGYTDKAREYFKKCGNYVLAQKMLR